MAVAVYGIGAYGVSYYGEEVTLSTVVHTGGGIKATPELWIATNANQLVDDITDLLIDGTVDMNVDRQITSSCQISIRDPDRIRPYVDYLAPRLRYSYEDSRDDVVQQVGLYALRIPPSEYTAKSSQAMFNGDDMTSDLASASLTDTWNIVAGTIVRTAMIDLIVDGGIPSTRIFLPESTVTLTAAKSFLPGTSNLEAVNALADMIGWYHVHTDLQGRITTPGEARGLAALEPFTTYTQDDIRSPSFTVNPSDLQVVNVVTVINENNAAAPMVATARNDDPNSPTSTWNIGERSYPGGPIRISGEMTQAALDRIALLYLSAGRSYYRTGSFSVLPDPQALIPHQSIALDLSSELEPLSGRWAIRTASIGFRPGNALLRLEVNQTRAFDGAAI